MGMVPLRLARAESAAGVRGVELCAISFAEDVRTAVGLP
jgi:hypothetical protein